MKQIYLVILVSFILFVSCGQNSKKTKSISILEVEEIISKSKLGELLFNDTKLSINGTMACATCHKEQKVFLDDRSSFVNHMAAISADTKFIGDRNVPSLSYAFLIPKFDSIFEDGERLYTGGFFLDGRSFTLSEQAKEPFVNPIEMQLPNAQKVVEIVKGNNSYAQAFNKFYKLTEKSSSEEYYDAISNAISTFEQSAIFAPFDSKYDRNLTGNYTFTEEEKRGLEIFKDESKANCIACHPISNSKAVFTDYTYDNLGVPKNTDLRSKNKLDSNFIDHGLLDNPLVSDTAFDGNFRVSSLRNIAVTSPYMHNGYFKALKTVIHFYNTRDVEGAISPETGKPWKVAEVPNTVNKEEMGDLKLSEQEENDLVSFLKTLTDKKYENKLKDNKNAYFSIVQ